MRSTQDAEGRMDLGDFASMLKTLDPEMGEMDVAHLFMELVDSKGCIDVDEWLQLLSLYNAGASLASRSNVCTCKWTKALSFQCFLTLNHISTDCTKYWSTCRPRGRRLFSSRRAPDLPRPYTTTPKAGITIH
jgi:hypothetical protein